MTQAPDNPMGLYATHIAQVGSSTPKLIGAALYFVYVGAGALSVDPQLIFNDHERRGPVTTHVRSRTAKAAHAMADEPGDALAAAAALDAPASTPTLAVTVTALSSERARAVVAHAVAATREPFCLFPNPTAGRRA